ncbi:hypothetical protein J4E85_005605 [Alternaria conjuncta]|uniref:uncharacterized protein n=1 Tax=Alternaria conjuncta TaxID=181017 RepID=UPI00222009ED|nr:uncharacterized protein J4E85_005605 [Alternaria conjuncta]KAI4928983.1 hypothetical protein J4E85_005605 [Alternaria conjuncta]
MSGQSHRNTHPEASSSREEAPDEVMVRKLTNEQIKENALVSPNQALSPQWLPASQKKPSGKELEKPTTASPTGMIGTKRR